jgi:hypothetical protein
MRRLPIILIALLAAGCAAGRPDHPTTGVRAGDLLQVREAGRRPVGVTATVDGRAVLFSARAHGAATLVEARDAATGAVRARRTLPGRWRLPQPAADGALEGVSANGRTLVLVDGSRFAFLDTGLSAPPRVAALADRYSYDALAPDGSILYLIEHRPDLGRQRYQVRALDVATGRLRPGVIADKRELGEPMAGYPLARATSPDGAWAYTLYQGPEHAFVHALSASQGYALCIDLPGGVPDQATLSYWGLALAGHTLYAANAALGVAAAIDGPTGEVARVGRLPRRAAPHGVAREGARVVLAPDGGTLYALGPRGLLAIDAASLRAWNAFLDGRRLDGLALSPDARRLYAVDRATGAVLALDARSGQRLGEVGGAEGALVGVMRAAA